MKSNKYTKLLGWIAAATMLLAASSCQDDIAGLNNDLASDEVTVTFTLLPEAAAGTRATADDGDGQASDGTSTYTYEPYISLGKEVDMLIYAVYQKMEDGTFTLIESYGDPESSFMGHTPGRGQTIEEIEGLPHTFQLTVKRNVDYTIAFWAQSSKTSAYDTQDLRKVQVHYNEVADADASADVAKGSESEASVAVPNNDETRDAFCRQISFKVAADGSGILPPQTIYLYRPLAQINVGTTGYDFEIVNRSSTKKYVYSKIRLNRVARFLDVVEDKTYSSTTNDDPYGNEKTPESFAVVDFDFALIPAYIQMDEEPTYPSHTIYDWIYNPTYSFTGDKDEICGPEYMGDYAKEEFLRVHLYDDATGGDVDVPQEDEARAEATPKPGDKDSEGYLLYANYNEGMGQQTETFKYLSMCYVLTSSTQTEAITINNIKVWLATSPDGADAFEIVNLNNVPAQRNWRTNIVGDLFTSENHFTVALDKDFAGEYNGILDDSADGAQWTGWLANGVYYDGAADEILISDKDGLLWFQRMVNGDLKVRENYTSTELTDSPAQVGDNYWYYTSYADKDGTEYRYTPVKETDPARVARILYATHQDLNQNYKESDYKDGIDGQQFHFVGDLTKKKAGDPRTKAQATVKLMADIDLKGEEWIPIGFDGRIIESVRKNFEESDATNRGFYGVFDGNGHSISNLTTKRFSATVHDKFQQTDSYGPYDNLQWFARGLFGMIGGNAVVKNVRLLNVDVYGCQCIGAVVGAAQGDAIQITDCVVDGGSIVATPMYRGDSHKYKQTKEENIVGRTFARGVYLGGVVGYFNTVDGVVDRCEVRNLFIQGYRRVGGIVGSILPTYRDAIKSEDNKETLHDGFRDSKPASISDNSISNTMLLASQFSTFGIISRKKSNTKPTPTLGFSEIVNNGFIPIGFGWDGGLYDLYAHEIVGGHELAELNSYAENSEGDNTKFENNTTTNLTFSKMTETRVDPANNKGPYHRESEIHETPLEHMPMLSAWYSDSITLYANYYGKPSAHTRQHLYQLNCLSFETDKTAPVSDGGNTFKFPIQVPRKVDVEWLDGRESTNTQSGKSSPKVGVYVGSVKLTGKKGIGGRSVITPEDVAAEGACAMYVCPEDRYQYNETPTNYQVSTSISDVVVRGMPYAYTGILLAPNRNTDLISLYNVAIYNVYQTLAADSWDDVTDEKVWPNKNTAPVDNKGKKAELAVHTCNLRGYTVPGKIWDQITYTATTFEKGTNTGHGAAEYTCKVEAPTKFSGCYFKAPYIIDLSEAGSVPTFTDCQATATSINNVPIDLTKASGTVIRIEIESGATGDPVVKYYVSGDTDGNYYDKDGNHCDKDGNVITSN